MPSASGKLSRASGSSAGGASFAEPARREKALKRQKALKRPCEAHCTSSSRHTAASGSQVATGLAGARQARCLSSEGEAAARTRAFGRRRRRGGRAELQPALHAGRAVGGGRRGRLLLGLFGLARRGGRAVGGGPSVLRLALLLLHLVLGLLLGADLPDLLSLLCLLDGRSIGLRGRSLLCLFLGLLVHRDASHSPVLHKHGCSFYHCTDYSPSESLGHATFVLWPARASTKGVRGSWLIVLPSRRGPRLTELKVGKSSAGASSSPSPAQ